MMVVMMMVVVMMVVMMIVVVMMMLVMMMVVVMMMLVMLMVVVMMTVMMIMCESHKWEKSENQNFLKSLKPYRRLQNSFPKIKTSFRYTKLRKNPENRGFTFFAVLPAYLGVSDSLAYSKRQGLKRSIDWYKKFMISCLVARYSVVFVLKSMEIHGNPWKSSYPCFVDRCQL